MVIFIKVSDGIKVTEKAQMAYGKVFTRDMAM